MPRCLILYFTTVSHVLTDHETIRRWAEARGARPASVKRVNGSDLGYAAAAICLDIPGASAKDAIEPITWHEWFRTFDEHDLALLIENASRQPSTFNKLVKRGSVEPSAPNPAMPHVELSAERPRASRRRRFVKIA